MSTWTDEQHKAAQEVVALITGARSPSPSLRILALRLSDALDEIERLRALTTITDEAVERAWTAYKAHSQVMHPRENNEYAACVECGWAFGWQGPTNPPGAQRVYEHAMRVALEAALNTEEDA